jgi:hypothetical protein
MLWFCPAYWSWLMTVCLVHSAFASRPIPLLQEANKSKKQSLYRPGQALKVPGGWGSQISRQSALEGGKVVSPTHRPPLPLKIFLVLISVRVWVDPRAIVQPKGLCQRKIPVNRTRVLPVCSAVPQPTAPLRPPHKKQIGLLLTLVLFGDFDTGLLWAMLSTLWKTIGEH